MMYLGIIFAVVKLKIKIMNKIYTLLLVGLCACNASQAQQFTFEPAGEKGKTIGVMMQKADVWIIREDAGNSYIDYYPVNLSDAYKIEGQEVVFEGTLGKIPSNVRLMGKPVKLTLIKKLYRASPREETDEMLPERTTNTKKETYKVKEMSGLVQQASGVWVIESTGNDKMQRYVPDYLPEDFQQVGLPVVFSGTCTKPDPNVRSIGIALTISEMAGVEEKAIDLNDIQEPMKNFYPFEVAGRIDTREGIIKKFSADPDVYIIETDNGTRRYLPALLPDDFKVHNMKVMVTGTYGSIPPNVRMVGTPFDIEVIEVVE
jgi:hypothetical protein